MNPRRYPPATVPPDHPFAQAPRQRLAVLRPGMVVDGVITRMVRGGVLVDVRLESGEPAFVPLAEIPAKSMPKVRELLDKGAVQQVRITLVDRASGTATASLQGLLPTPGGKGNGREDGESDGAGRRPVRAPVPAPPPAARAAPAPAAPRASASDRARKQQEEIMRRLRGGA